MTLCFEAAHGSAIDKLNGLEIFRPRFEPRTEQGSIAYEYALYRDDERYAISCIGMHAEIEDGDNVSDIFTLDLGEGWVLQGLRELKNDLAIDGSEFDFVWRLAEGMVGVFQSRTSKRPVRYIAVADAASLKSHGLRIAPELPVTLTGQIVLAEIMLPAQLIDQ